MRGLLAHWFIGEHIRLELSCCWPLRLSVYMDWFDDPTRELCPGMSSLNDGPGPT